MKRLMRSRQSNIGLSPGTLIHIGQQKAEDVSIHVLDYADDTLVEQEITELSDLSRAADMATVTWVNVVGLHDTERIEAVGKIFVIHPLLLEDILNTDQRPKFEQTEDALVLILKMLQWNQVRREVDIEQVSLVLGNAFVVTFQEQSRDIFEALRQRIREGRGRIRKSGADFLANAIVDAVVDQYFLILEQFGEEIEGLEAELVADPTPDTLQRIHSLKRELLMVRRAIWPLREVLSSLQRGETPLFQDATLIYLRDVYEHVIHVLDTLETFREVTTSMIDIYLSSVSNRMNEVMKVLTVIATLFIPLTFITSLYGMNFVNMPELQWPLGYPLVWGAILSVSAGMLIYFRRKGWL